MKAQGLHYIRSALRHVLLRFGEKLVELVPPAEHQVETLLPQIEQLSVRVRQCLRITLRGELEVLEKVPRQDLGRVTFGLKGLNQRAETVLYVTYEALFKCRTDQGGQGP